MTIEQTKHELKNSLQAFTSGDSSKTITAKSMKLFQVLGYMTERSAPLDNPTFAEFKDIYIENKKFDIIKAIVTLAKGETIDFYAEI